VSAGVIPPLRGADPGTGPRRRAWRPDTYLGAPSRRTVLRAGVALGTAAGMAALGVFPAVRKAHADGYDIYGSCPSYATDHNCSPGCGPSTIFGDSCNLTGANLGFHKDDGVTWMLRPNQCFDNTFDGWVWRFQGACGTCACFVERRCHDGYRRTGSGWVRSICRWNTDCGCQGSVDFPVVARGASGGNVRAIQELLNARGATLDADGQYGPLTEAAVSAFQRDNGLTATGTVDAPTWPVLVATVRRGDSSGAVRAAQVELNRYGYQLTVDGVFGELTDGAARNFQLQAALTVDGVVGRNTWRTLAGGAGVA
jgi:Putative peptidoglycan binding domain